VTAQDHRRHPTIRRWARIAIRGVVVLTLVAVGLLAVGLAIVLVPVARDPSPGFIERKGELLAVHETARWIDGPDDLTELTLISTTGLVVDITARVPREPTTPRPAMVLLAGQGTGRDAVRYIHDSRGVVAVSVSYPYRGDKKAGKLALILDTPRIQRSLLDTIPAIMLVADWLIRQPYVDPRRIELAGGSMGAFLVSVPGALDTRFRRVWLVHGGGKPADVLERGLEQHIRSALLRKWTARLLAAAAASHHLAPEKWVGKISPRPVIVISAVDDETIPRECVDTLHRALGQPSEVVWMETGHVMPGREAIIEQLLDLTLRRIKEDEPATAPR